MLVEKLIEIRGTTDRLTGAVADAIGLRWRKDAKTRAAIRAAVEAEVRRLADDTRRMAVKAHLAATRSAVSAAISAISRKRTRPKIKAKPATLPAEIM